MNKLSETHCCSCDRKLRLLLYTEHLKFALCCMFQKNRHMTMSAEAGLNAIVVT
jgi:hypothetical protein